MSGDRNQDGRLFLYQICILVIAAILQFDGIFNIYRFLPFSLLISPDTLGFAVITALIIVGFLYEERIMEHIESYGLSYRFDAVLISLIILYLVSGLLLFWAIHDIRVIGQRRRHADAGYINEVKLSVSKSTSLQGDGDENQKRLLREKYRRMERSEKIYSFIPSIVWIMLTVPGIPFLGGVQADAAIILLLPMVISLIPIVPAIINSLPGAKIKRAKAMEGFIGMTGTVTVKWLKNQGKLNLFYIKADHSRLQAISEDRIHRGDLVAINGVQYIPGALQKRQPFAIVSLIPESKQDHS